MWGSKNIDSKKSLVEKNLSQRKFCTKTKFWILKSLDPQNVRSKNVWATKKVESKFQLKIFFLSKTWQVNNILDQRGQKNLCSNFFVQIIVSPENLWSKKKVCSKKSFGLKNIKLGPKKNGSSLVKIRIELRYSIALKLEQMLQKQMSPRQLPTHADGLINQCSKLVKVWTKSEQYQLQHSIVLKLGQMLQAQMLSGQIF